MVLTVNSGARLYVPREEGRGLLVYFHGGGWVVGDLDTQDPLCRALAADAGSGCCRWTTASPPRRPRPTAAEDAIAAFAWAVEHAEELGADPGLVAVGGDSAGGNLAAVVAQQGVLPRPPGSRNPGAALPRAGSGRAAVPAETCSRRASSSPKWTSSGTGTTTPLTPGSHPDPIVSPMPRQGPVRPGTHVPHQRRASTPSETKASTTPKR